ncbi:hypothetical protein RRG08_036749 [Elysia crispata]|uniref:Uncharacterized protein n=1 Tax=Elysia crispata TaxID=231223 RepID=A0AAE1DGK8_9GAST|nr:hypothetical protein RRG08_036749 [Elysia crispata]
MPQGSLQLIHSEISSTWEGEAGSEIPRSMAVIYVESQICLTSAPDRVRARQIDGIDGLCSIAAADQGTVPHRVQAKVVRCAPPVPLDGSLSLSSSMSQVPVLGKGDIHAGWEEEKQTVWGGGESLIGFLSFGRPFPSVSSLSLKLDLFTPRNSNQETCTKSSFEEKV